LNKRKFEVPRCLRRQRIEEPNVWLKTVAVIARAPFRGLEPMGWTFAFRSALAI